MHCVASSYLKFKELFVITEQVNKSTQVCKIQSLSFRTKWAAVIHVCVHSRYICTVDIDTLHYDIKLTSVYKHQDKKTYGRRQVNLHTQFLISTHDREQLNFNMRGDFQCPLPNGAQIRSEQGEGRKKKKQSSAP
jgi:hypothetical protein